MESNHGLQGHEPCTLPLSYLAFYLKKNTHVSIIFLGMYEDNRKVNCLLLTIFLSLNIFKIKYNLYFHNHTNPQMHIYAFVSQYVSEDAFHF